MAANRRQTPGPEADENSVSAALLQVAQLVHVAVDGDTECHSCFESNKKGIIRAERATNTSRTHSADLITDVPAFVHHPSAEPSSLQNLLPE